MLTLEREIQKEAADILKNRKLRIKDIREWSTGDITPEDGEVVIRCPGVGVNVCVFKTDDKR